MKTKDSNKKIMQKVLDSISFYKDAENDEIVYAEVPLNTHTELVYVESRKFHAYIRQMYKFQARDSKIFNYNEMLQAKCDSAILSSVSIRPYRRIAGDDEKVVYFLANPTHDTIIIDANGWQSQHQTEYKFLNQKSMKAHGYPIPFAGKILDLLRPYFNMEEDTFKLCVINLIQWFFPCSSHFVSVISAPKGTGKSTFSALLHDIIDPSIIKHSFMPNSVDELKNHLANNTVVVFDNTRQLTDIESDILCAATTETYMTKRTLYTTHEETILRLKNIIILNGIEIIPQKADLLERSLLFELKPIPSNKRMTERNFWSKFDNDKAFIMGAIFNTISRAMQIKKTLTLSETHRMSDAYTDMVAISLALGIGKDEFTRIFNANKDALHNISQKNNMFCTAINDFFDSCCKTKIKCTVSELYKSIKESKVCERSALPNSASAFSRKLNEEKSSLQAIGIDFMIVSERNASYITIQRLCK